MGKRFSLFFALLLIFQTITSSLAFPLQLNAQGIDADVFKNISVKDEAGQEVNINEVEGESNVAIHVDWSISDLEVEAGSQYSTTFDEPLEVLKQQEGTLTVGENEDAEVGIYKVATDGTLLVTFTEKIAEHTNADGTIIIEARIESGQEEAESEESDKSDEADSNELQQTENENTDANVSEDAESDGLSTKEDEEVADENSEATDANSDDQAEVDEATEDETNGITDSVEAGKAGNAATFAEEREPQAITENIIDEFKLLYEDGTEYKDGDLLEIGEDLRLELDWSLPNDHEYKNGDYFEFQLPKQLQVYNEITGDLGEYGSYVVTTDGKVTFTFNENIENNSNVHGDFWFDTELDEQEIKSTTEDLEIIYNDDVLEKITINVKPTGGQAIHKEGQPVGGNFNTEEIEWTVLVNTTRDDLKNAIVNDPIFEGLELDLGSIKLQEVEVDINGNVTEELDVVTNFTNNSTKEALKLELGDTNKAYKLTFKTKMKEEEKDNEGTKNYPNTVYLNSDGQPEKQSGTSVSVNRPKSMEKTSSEFDKEDRFVEWEVKANFNEKNLNEGDVITDEFTFTVGGEALNDVFEIKEADIEIVQVDSFDSNGNVVDKSDAKDLFDITIEGNKVTYKLKKDTDKAFILKYKTEVKDGAYITNDGQIVNNVDLNGNTATSSQGVIQQVGKKTNAGIDYENKTIDWTITINADKQDLRNFVLTDDFSGSEQKLVDGSINIDPSISEDKITPNEDGEGFVIDFGDITDTYTITYQTKFTYDFEGEKTPNFKNNVDITYTTSDEGPEYELEIGNEVPPNEETKSNGAKNGTANNETKEITWTIDINYNQLKLSDAKLIDEIAENQSLVDGSVKIYPTTIDKHGIITAGDDVTEQFKEKITASENQVDVDFGPIDQSYRVEFMTKDKDGVYNSDEVYENTAQFIPREGEEHNLEASVTLPNQGEFLGKKGLHNREDWTIDWEVDVNKSKSKLTDAKLKDDLGSTNVQILLEDSINVTKEGSDEELVEGEDYKLTVDGNELIVHFPGEITDHYKVTYSSYILSEEDANITNEAKIESVDEVIVGNTEKTETVQVKVSTGGGSAAGETGGLTIEKVEAGTDRPLENVAFELVKEVGNEKIVVREGTTDADGKLEWKGLKYGDYTLNEVIPEGYLGEEEQTVTISSEDPEGIKILTIENERQTGTAKIVKVDAVTDDKLAGAEFKITNETTGQTYTFTTDENGEISEEVPFGEYTVEEVTAPNGYRITEDIDNITVKIDETTEITVTNEAIVEVAGKKTWITDADQELPESITVELLADGSKIDEKEVTAADDWTYSFTNLDKYDAEDNVIRYSIEEVKLDGYVSEKDGYDLTNIQTIDISGEKTWVEVDDQHRPDSITVNLLANVKEEPIAPVAAEEPVATVEVSAETDWTFVFTNLPKYDSEGNEIEYTIEEVDTPGYTSEVEGFNITNTQETIELSGTKTWLDDEEDPPLMPWGLEEDSATDDKDATGSRPKSITVQVKNGEEVVQEQEVSANGDWTYTFTDLPKYDKTGKEIKYTIAEVVPEGYEAIINGNDITNLRVGTIDVEISKLWKDEVETDRPERIKVNLLQNGEFYKEYEVTKENDWELTITDLPEFDEEGVAYEYTIKEHDVPGYAADVDGFNITNTRTDVKTIELSKTWLDNDDATGDRPESIEVELFRSITDGDKELVETYTLASENDWKLVVEDLPSFDEDGKAYTYVVEEESVEGYEASVNGFDITNVRTGTTEVSGTKTWADNNDATGDRPESITVKLLQNGKEIATQEVRPDEDGNWKYNFTDLDEFDENGIAYGYTIDEEDVDGYAKSADGNDLINTRVGETEVSGTKTWLDDGAVDERPESITVLLLQNGTVFAKEVVTAEDNWEYSFEHLPRFDENGVEWGYTIDEEDVDGYSKSADGNDLINTRVGETEVSGTKTWLDNDDATGDRPDTIIVNLLQNGTLFTTAEVTADDDWEYSFTHLPEFDDQGVAYEYTVDEETVDGYETTIEGYDITNLRVGTTEVEITKLWKDEQETDRPETIKVNLLQNGDFYEEYEITKENDWQLTILDLPKYDEKGVAYKYTVTEHDVPGYASEVDGFEITNTRADVKTIEITKTWLDDDSKNRPASIEVELYRSVVDGEKELVDTFTITAENDWSLEVADLPSFDADGNAYTYEIEEKAVEGYETSINGFDITNLRVGTIEISGTKTWVGDDAENRPSSIVVELVRNGEKVGQILVSADSNWVYHFYDLPQYDENGVAYVYTVAEQEVAGYTSVVNGYDIINTLIPVDPEDPETPEKPVDPEAPVTPEPEEPGDGNDLPKTATNVFNLMIIGFALTLVGFVSLFVRRRKQI